MLIFNYLISVTMISLACVQLNSSLVNFPTSERHIQETILHWRAYLCEQGAEGLVGGRKLAKRNILSPCRQRIQDANINTL